MTEKEQEALKKESDTAYNFLSNFCQDYCKSEEDRKEFYKNLSDYINAEIELEKFCNQ